MHPADRVALRISLGKSINVPRENGLTVPAARHVRSKSESDGSSEPFASKLPPAVTNVPKEDIRGYLHSKRVNNYLVGNTLGQGSFAKVKEALHQLVGEKVRRRISYLCRRAGLLNSISSSVDAVVAPVAVSELWFGISTTVNHYFRIEHSLLCWCRCSWI